MSNRCFISKSSYTPSYLTPFYPEHLKSRCAKPRFYPLRSLNNPTRFLSVMPFLLRFFIVLWIIVAYNYKTKRRQKIASSFFLVYLPPFSFYLQIFYNICRNFPKDCGSSTSSEIIMELVNAIAVSQNRYLASPAANPR